MVDTGDNSNKIDISTRGNKFCSKCQVDYSRYDDTARELHLIRHILETLITKQAPPWLRNSS